jgi:pSer/pThr/pTyr-binding forkhead associated (FHA) protein
MFPTYRLVAHSGPIAGKAFPLEKNEIFIGRDLGNDIVINDPEMSRRHARVFIQGQNFAIEDLGSTNGTYVNGQRLMGPYILRPGEVVTFGERISLLFESTEPDSGATVAANRPASPFTTPAVTPVQPQQAYTPPQPPYNPPQPQQAQRYTPPPPIYGAQQPSVEPVAAEPVAERRRFPAWLIILIILLVLICICVFAAVAVDVTDSWCYLFGWLFNIFSPGICPTL